MKRKIFLYLTCALCHIQGVAQNQSDTYIATVTPKEEMTTISHIGAGNVLTSTQYFDGLARPIGSVQRGCSPDGRDIYTSITYDAYGRESQIRLPTTRYGLGRMPSTQSDILRHTVDFHGDSKPYTSTNYEDSPLSRECLTIGPGNSWHAANKGISKQYLSNSTTDEVLKCKRYSGGSIINGGTTYYADGELSVIKTMDEDNSETYEFINKQGKTVLIRTKLGSRYLDTYYLYDTFERLSNVLPPMVNGNTDAASLNKYAYHYKYDNRDRCIEKKLPGCEPVKYVYDNANRLIFMQDGVQRQSNEWTFMFYDTFGRETVKGICTGATLPDVSESVIKTSFVGTSNSAVLQSGYTLTNALSLTYQKLLTANYYDDYSYRMLMGPDFQSYLNYNFEDVSESEYGHKHDSAKGAVTGTLHVGANSTSRYFSAIYYDEKGRVVQFHEMNELGGYERNHYAYSFTGKVLRHHQAHFARSLPQQNRVNQLYAYEYDNAERLKKVTHKINENPVATLVDYEYDGIGRIKQKRFHGSDVNKQVYGYNVRSWVTQLANSKFTQNLHYNTGVGTPYYNGNISSMTWKAGNETTTRGYKFTYDDLSRMTNAAYGEGANIATNSGRFSETPTYDDQGNILTMKRYGQTSASTYGLTDSLTFAYNGNQLKYVNDSQSISPDGESFHFADGVNSTANEYTYNANGNMTADLNKGITEIQYNCLNLPNRVIWDSNTYIDYKYDAAGVKRKTTHKSNNVTKETTYCGNVIYEGYAVKRVLTSEGYITFSGTTPTYHYYLKDHLGNNQVVTDADGTVQQVNHYYPFGGVFASTSEEAQPYKYNGKELDRENGLDLYDYSARYMDPGIGRFTTVDPLAEKYYGVSPYAYCGNNPIRRIDPTGMYWKDEDDEEYARSLAKALNEARMAALERGAKNFKAYNKALAKGDTEKAARIKAESEGIIKDINNLSASISELAEMGNAEEQAFAFKKADGDEGGADIESNGDIVMEISGDATSGNAVHEASHGYDFWKKGPIKSIDDVLDMEKKAYSRQFSFAPKSLPTSVLGTVESLNDITLKWIYGIKDAKGEFLYMKRVDPDMDTERFLKVLKSQ